MTKTVTGDNAQVLNMIRELAPPSYAERIPVAVDENWAQIGNTILGQDYKLEYNTFIDVMFNKIGKTFIKDAMMHNPFAHFNKGKLPLGTDIEEVFVGLTDLKMFDPEKAEKEVFKREKNDVKVLFHREDFKGFYKVTVSRAEMKGAFSRPNGLSSLMNKIISSMTNSWKLDSFLLTKKLMNKMADEYHKITVPEVKDQKTGEDFIKAVIQNSMDQRFPSAKFNSQGVIRMEDTNNMTLILHKDIAATMSVDVLSKAFNKADLNMPAHIIYTDDFGGEEMKDVQALLLDNNFIQIWDTESESGSIYNPEGLYSNFFLHKWGIYSASLFHNAVAFVKAGAEA